MSETNFNFWNFENIYQITLLTFCAGIFILSCYLRRKKKPKIAMTICKQQIKNGDTVFIFERDELKSKACNKIVLCEFCHSKSPFKDNPHWRKVTAQGNVFYCMCGLRDKWNKKVGIHRICTHHKLAIRDRLQGKCQYLIVGNLKIPISPDGIPMVNLATAISKIEDEINEEFDEDLEKGSKKEDCQENRKNKATGLLMMFSWSRIPKIAGDNYRPAAWIPFKPIIEN
ncbi:unnamed protein product [Oikopleura dioica]|uniref:Uncharacterized protein n=1 Tax=Oikopleura dioica TaxID=34765 RepID=E4Z1V5_OIKDI|nr:unnamed protein product [Oikopleura dioica]